MHFFALGQFFWPSHLPTFPFVHISVFSKWSIIRAINTCYLLIILSIILLPANVKPYIFFYIGYRLHTSSTRMQYTPKFCLKIESTH